MDRMTDGHDGKNDIMSGRKDEESAPWASMAEKTEIGDGQGRNSPPDGAPPAALADEISAADERKLVRKMDSALIPLVMGLYLFSFLDR